MVQKSNNKIVIKEALLMNTTINCPITYSGSILWYFWLLFFIHFVAETFANCMNREKLTLSLYSFLRQQRKYEMRTQTSMNNTVNDLHYEVKFENSVKDKNNFFIRRNIAFFFLEQKYILFSETYFFKIPKNIITSALFCRGRY